MRKFANPMGLETLPPDPGSHRLSKIYQQVEIKQLVPFSADDHCLMSVPLSPIRVGRVVLGGEVRNVMLPHADRYTFNFSRYERILPVCKNAASERRRVYLPADREKNLFWQRVAGYETGNAADDSFNEYRRVPLSFGILAGAAYCYKHPALESVVQQLGISQLTPFYSPQDFGLSATEEQIPMEVDQMSRPTGRTATFEATATINQQPYLIEVKGVNFADGPIKTGQDYGDGECAGGLPDDRMQRSIEVLGYLNKNGYDSVILLAAYTIPGLRQFDGKPLGAYIRAVRSSPPVSHYHENLKDVADSLDMPRMDLAEHIIRSAARDAARMWKLGVIHGWIHEQNIRIDGLSDLTGAKYISRTGFRGIVRDTEMLIASSQKIMRRLVEPDLDWPSEELYETDPEKAERLVFINDESHYQDQTAHYFAAREIITDELNRQLDLFLPPAVGTMTLAAEIYIMQRELGLTRPDEKIEIEHVISHSHRKSLTLNDVRHSMTEER